MQVQAKAKSLRVSPRKLGLVAALVRGRSVEEALTILENTPRRAARSLHEVIHSARANAEHNFSLPIDKLTVAIVTVTPGFVLKRAKAASRGSMHRIRHRTSHVRVVVESDDKAQNKVSKKKSVKPKTAARKGNHGSKS